MLVEVVETSSCIVFQVVTVILGSHTGSTIMVIPSVDLLGITHVSTESGNAMNMNYNIKI